MFDMILALDVSRMRRRWYPDFLKLAILLVTHQAQQDEQQSPKSVEKQSKQKKTVRRQTLIFSATLSMRNDITVQRGGKGKNSKAQQQKHGQESDTATLDRILEVSRD